MSAGHGLQYLRKKISKRDPAAASWKLLQNIKASRTAAHFEERHTNNTSAIIANGIMNADNKDDKNVRNVENINDNIIKESANAKG